MKRALLKPFLLTVPVWLVPLGLYIAAGGQVKSIAGFFFVNGMIVAWLELVVLFVYRLAVVIRDKFRR